jgi:hypothetical protein
MPGAGDAAAASSPRAAAARAASRCERTNSPGAASASDIVVPYCGAPSEPM